MNKLIKSIIVICASLAVIAAGVYVAARKLYPTEYMDLVVKYSDEFGVDANLVYSVIKCESGFDCDAESSIGALGLMQITPDTFDWAQKKLHEKGIYDATELYNPEINVMYGTYLLKLHLDEFGSTALAVTAYHAGRGKVNEWLSSGKLSTDTQDATDIPYADTRTYVERVLRTIKIYETLY